MNDIAILGAGGQAQEIGWWITDDYTFHYNSLVFSEEGYAPQLLIRGRDAYPITHVDWIEENRKYLAGVGDPFIKWILTKRTKSKPADAYIHPTAFVCDESEIGKGSVIGPYCMIGPEVKIGENVILNPYTFIGHGSKIGDFSTCCSGTLIAGNCRIGRWCFLGAGSTIRQAVKIPPATVIGMGAVVIHSMLRLGSQKILLRGIPADAL